MIAKKIYRGHATGFFRRKSFERWLIGKSAEKIDSPFATGKTFLDEMVEKNLGVPSRQSVFSHKQYSREHNSHEHYGDSPYYAIWKLPFDITLSYDLESPYSRNGYNGRRRLTIKATGNKRRVLRLERMFYSMKPPKKEEYNIERSILYE